MNRTLVSLGVVMSMGTLAVGCAHNQTRTVNQAPAPVVATAPPPAPAKPAPTPQEDEDALLRSATLKFDFDAATLTKESEERLQRVAKVLRSHAGLKAKVSGNCDERGTEEYNLALGQRRAGVAKRYLVQLGVDAERVDTVSFGHERPKVNGHDEAAWAENRRDEIDVSGAP